MAWSAGYRGAFATWSLFLLAVGCGRAPLLPPDDETGAAGATGGAAGSTAAAGVTGTAGTNGAAGTTAGPWMFFDSLRGLNRDIYAIQPTGSGLRRITTSGATEREPAVSPDGTTLAYSSDEGGDFQVYLKALPAGPARRLTQHPGGARFPAWSPDGRRLAYAGDVSIYLVDANGENDRILADGLDPNNANSHPAFLLNGRGVVFDRGNQIHRVDLDTGEEVSVVQNTTTQMSHPSVSPDGHSIAFNVRCFDGTPESIWVVPVADNTFPCMGGARVTTAKDGTARLPAFSPTGVIAFEHGEEVPRLAIVQPGGPVKDVTDGKNDDRNPSWAPAGFVLP